MTTIDIVEPAVVRAARALSTRVRDAADAIERDRRLPSALVTAMAQAGLFRMAVPRHLGGLEADPATIVRAIEEVARVDGSAGWCVMIGATSGVTSAYLRDDVARAIYGDPLIVTGGALAPTGRAETADGGYRVSGRWAFGSGIEHCAWRIANTVVIENGAARVGAGGVPETRSVIVPAGDTEVLDTWTVSGLRGTGSHDFTIADRFVPAERSFSLLGPPLYRDGPLYRFPVFGLLALGVAATATGMARGAIDALAELASLKTPTGSRRLLRERVYAQMQVAEAEALLRAARAFLFDATAEAWQAAQADRPLAAGQRAIPRLAATHATTSAARAVDMMYSLGGASSIYAANSLQRFFRDVHAATQHVMVSPSILETTGRLFLGLESDTAML
jgi:alkylation response protein AidB-like acyl-CoA dehydrogenase